MQQSFSDLGVSARIVRALAERKIHEPFPIQARVLEDALTGRDVLAKAPTGSGKTLAFAIPIVERLETSGRRPAALVLVPTRELATQVAGELTRLAPADLRVATIYGGVPLQSQAKRARGAHVLVATPGRLNDLLERKAIDLDGVRILVLDEADRMLDMGFKPQVDRIVRRIPAKRQTMFFSATLDSQVGELARAYTSNPVRCEAEQCAGFRGRRCSRAPVRPGQSGQQGRDARGSPAQRGRAHACLRAYAAGRRPARPQARATRRERRRHARRPEPGPAGAGATEVRVG